MRDYNFFEFFAEEKKTNDLRFVYVGIITSIIVGAMVVIYLTNVFKIRALEDSIYESQLTISSTEFATAYSQKQKDDERLKLLNNYYTSVSNLNESISKEDYIKTELLKRISSVVPQSVSFQNMNISDKTITMTGTSSTRVAIGELQYNLKELDIFEDIHVSTVSSSSEDASNYSFNFNITFKLKEGYGNEN
jgi:type IV pilus assembly protein PilN